ncbi:MAG: hypothetical protein CMM93_07120 [Rickettsiales bacterium]|nr:hypothetical protein [Rickettsiales bacterium]
MADGRPVKAGDQPDVLPETAKALVLMGKAEMPPLDESKHSESEPHPAPVELADAPQKTPRKNKKN